MISRQLPDWIRHAAAVAIRSTLLRTVCVIALSLQILASVSATWVTILGPAGFQRRDLSQDYLAEQAILSGINPYLRIAELSNKFQATDSLTGFDHPTPHSPAMLTLLSPLGLLSESTFHQLWLFGAMTVFALCAAAVCYRIRSRGVSLAGGLLISAIFLDSPSVLQDIHYGQLNAVLLPAVLLLWIGLNRSHIGAGAALGLLLALRGFGLPFFLAFLIDRKFREAAAAIAVFAFCQLVSAAVISWQAILGYFLSYAHEAVQCWQGQAANTSLITLPQKLLGSRLISFGSIPAACREPVHSPLISSLGPLVALLACLVIIRRTRNSGSDSRFAFLLLLSIICAPLTWPHYFLLLMPAALICLVELKNAVLTRGYASGSQVAALLIYFLLSRSDWIQYWYRATHAVLGAGIFELPSWAILLSAVPTIAALLLILFAPSDFLIPGSIATRSPEPQPE